MSPRGPESSPLRASLQAAIHRARRVVVIVVSATVLAMGVALLVLPGPGLAMLAIGLALLATEVAWAKRWQRRLTARLAALVDGVHERVDVLRGGDGSP
jgi:Flp pilus assembly protein TadB